MWTVSWTGKERFPFLPTSARRPRVVPAERIESDTRRSTRVPAVQWRHPPRDCTLRRICSRSWMKSGIRRVFLTLHVGPGTFLPIRSEDARHHRVPSEWFESSRPDGQGGGVDPPLQGARGRGGNHRGTGAGARGATGRRRRARGMRPHAASRRHLPLGGCFDHQFPPASDHAPASRRRVRRPGADSRSLPSSPGSGLPVLTATATRCS
jgi:hypothetical protein